MFMTVEGPTVVGHSTTVRFFPNSSKPVSNVTWYHYPRNSSPVELTDTPRTKFSETNGRFSLIIQNTTKSDEGTYRAVAKHDQHCNITVVLKGQFY